MNHQQFEQWLLTDETVSREQAEHLRSHLNACEACRRLSTSWSDVRQLLRSAPLAGPQPGFVGRWQAQLEVQIAREMQAHHRSQTRLVLILAMLGAASFFALMVTQLTSTFSAPSQILVYWLGQVAALLSTANVVQEIVNVLFRTISAVIPLSYWMVLLASLSVLFLFWILSLQRIYIRGGVLNEAEN